MIEKKDVTICVLIGGLVVNFIGDREGLYVLILILTNVWYLWEL